jgi:hypothetical protein
MRVRSHDHTNRIATPDTSDLAARTAGGEPGGGEETEGTTAVHHGIHVARFPLRGLTIAQARRVLSPMLNIDPTAVAVIGAEIIEDEDARTITGEEEMLGFVKRSSVKGAA